MIKQEEIREGIAIQSYGTHVGEVDNRKHYELADKVIQFLHSQGVVLKVEGELPEMKDIILGATWEEQRNVSYSQSQQDMLKAGYEATEPLIEED